MPVLSGSMAKALPLNSTYLKHGVIFYGPFASTSLKLLFSLKKISWERKNPFLLNKISSLWIHGDTMKQSLLSAFIIFFDFKFMILKV